MVNTVGSYKTKYWHKSLIPVKEKMFLNPLQFSIIIGSLLGDGTMRIGKGAINANFKIEHGIEQKEYVFWKYEALKPIVFTEPKLSYRYNERDDGSYSDGKIDISTYSFTLPEINLLQKSFVQIFDINPLYYKDRDKGYRMYFNKGETRKAINIIKHHIIPSMMYKIGL